MNVQDLLLDPAIQLPLTRTENDFSSYVKGLLGEFKEKLDQLDSSDQLTVAVKAEREKIGALCDGIQKVIDSFLDGQPHQAFVEFDNAVKPVRSELDKMGSNEDLGEILKSKCIYRFRSQVSPALTREELFHIPFESRHMVKPQRYSIQGLPCLYLGGSVYTCWAEMGMPAFSDLQASAFWLKNKSDVEIIDLSHRPVWLADLLEKVGVEGLSKPNLYYYISHVVCWPIMAVASIKRMQHNASFVAEYILPQIILQWITKQRDVDGIRYFSTHVEFITGDPHWTSNYVFPAKRLKPKGRCDRLVELFKMTEPMNWQILSTSQITTRHLSQVNNFMIELIKGVEEEYGKTEFGTVQNALNSLAKTIKDKNLSVGGQQLGDVQS